MQKNLKPIAITMGDPAGIGGEIILKSLGEYAKINPDTRFIVIDDGARLSALARLMGLNTKIINFNNFEEFAPKYQDNQAIYCLNLPHKIPLNLGNPSPEYAQMVIKSIEIAAQLCLNHQARAMTTAPIAKNILQDAGFAFPGHTEFLAYLTKDSTPLMLLCNQDFAVMPLTIHIALSQVPKAITADLIIDKITLLHRELIAKFPKFQQRKPRIGVLGLNPHAGESGKMGLEEIEIINPALNILRQNGLNIIGALPADTAFHQESRQNFDCVVGMYHDQVLIPIKTIDFHGAVNCTLGLKIIRTSPDHGTAFNISAKLRANHHSMLAALKQADEMAQNS